MTSNSELTMPMRIVRMVFEISNEITRLLVHESKVIQAHQELVEMIKL